MEGDPGSRICVQNEQPHRINISLPAAGPFFFMLSDRLLAFVHDCTTGQADFFRVLKLAYPWRRTGT